MGEAECGSGYLADLAGADGDMLECSPAAGEQGEPAFAETAQRAQQHVGAGVDVEFGAVGGLLDRGEHADAGAVVSVVGQGGQVELGGCGIEGGQGVSAGAGDVMFGAGFDIARPRRAARPGTSSLKCCRRSHGSCRSTRRR